MQLGLGVVVPVNERTPQRIRSAVRTVLAEPDCRTAAQKVDAEIAGAPPIGHAVTLLEGLVGADR